MHYRYHILANLQQHQNHKRKHESLVNTTQTMNEITTRRDVLSKEEEEPTIATMEITTQT